MSAVTLSEAGSGKLAEAGELLIRAVAVLSGMSEADRSALKADEQGAQVHATIGFALETVGRVSTETMESLRSHPPCTTGFESGLVSFVKNARSTPKGRP